MYHFKNTVGITLYLLPRTVLFHLAIEYEHFPTSKIFSSDTFLINHIYSSIRVGHHSFRRTPINNHL